MLPKPEIRCLGNRDSNEQACGCPDTVTRVRTQLKNKKNIYFDKMDKIAPKEMKLKKKNSEKNCFFFFFNQVKQNISVLVGFLRTPAMAGF